MTGLAGIVFRGVSGVDGELRADQVAKPAVYAGVFLAFGDDGVVISLGIDVGGILEDVRRAIVDAEIALLAAFRNDVDAAYRHLCGGEVYWLA